MRLLATGAALLSLGLVTGCANRSACTAAATGTGFLLGATTGGLISGVAANHGDSGGSKNWEIGLSTGGGALAGGLIGFGLAQAICGEDEPPPPPPPPAPSYEEPPPPPPPPTERRGG